MPIVLQQLVDYLMTHSERITAINEERETEQEQHAFLAEGLAPLFEGGVERRLVFGIWVETYSAIP